MSRAGLASAWLNAEVQSARPLFRAPNSVTEAMPKGRESIRPRTYWPAAVTLLATAQI